MERKEKEKGQSSLSKISSKECLNEGEEDVTYVENAHASGDGSFKRSDAEQIKNEEDKDNKTTEAY